MRYALTALIFALISLTSYSRVNGQQISGYVTIGEDRIPIASGNITLNSLPDSLIIAFTHTDEFGYFKISVPSGKVINYYLKVTHVNTIDKYIQITSPDLMINDLQIQMAPRIFVLDEIEIVALSPAITKGDTTNFNVQSFQNGSEKTLEDVLKKMPHMRVETNGDVYFKNKRIDKILLDGDNLLENGYQLATRSIDPNVLDKIQAFENYNDNKLLKQIEQSDKTVLNLKVKEEKKSLLFGNIDLGLGKSNYNGTGSFFSYKKRLKAYSMLSGNNIGMERLSPINIQSNIPVRKINNVDQKIKLFNPANNNAFIRSINSPLENINNEKIATVNFTVTPKKNIKLTSNLLVSSDKQSQDRNESFESIVDEGISYLQFDTLIQRGELVQGRLEGDYDISSSTNLTFKSIFSLNSTPLNQTTQLFTSIDTLKTPQKFKNSVMDWRQFVDFTKKINEKNAFVTSLELSNFQISEALDLQLNPSLREQIFDSPSSDGLINQKANQYHKNLLGNIGWLYGTKNKKIEIYVGYSHLDYNSEIFQVENTEVNKLSQNLTRSSLIAKSIGTVTWKKIKGTGNIQLSRIQNNSANRQQTSTLLQSNLNLSYTLNKLNGLIFSYSNVMSPVSNSYLIDGYILNDYRSAQIGNSNLVFDNQEQVSLTYLFTDLQRLRMTIMANVYGIKFNDLWDFAAYNQTSEFTISELINTPNTNASGINFTTEKLVYPIYGNIKVDFKLTQNNLSQIVNSLPQSSRSLSHSTTIKYVSVFDFPLNVEAGASLISNSVKVMNNNNSAETMFTISSQFVKLFYNSNNANFILTTENYRIQNGNNVFIKAKFSYKFKERLTLGIEGQNLTNQKSLRQLSVRPTLYRSSSTGLLKRFVLIQAAFLI